jgi:hypothetical protein
MYTRFQDVQNSSSIHPCVKIVVSHIYKAEAKLDIQNSIRNPGKTLIFY